MKNWCKVLPGVRDPDPYTGKTIRFVVAGDSEIDFDHVVALADPWQKGAVKWVAGKRLASASDPRGLLAADADADADANRARATETSHVAAAAQELPV